MTDLLVIAPHPDDEILGCGATMARYLREGKSVAVLYVGEGCFPDVNIRVDALDALGGAKYLFVGHYYKDQRFEKYSRAKMAERIMVAIDGHKPATVLIPFYGDVNLDHRVVFEAAMVALRPTRDFIKRVACYEVVSSTEWGTIHPFKPNWWVEVTEDDLLKKGYALDAYESEMKEQPHPRNKFSQFQKAGVRGSEVCATTAEAFMIIREVERIMGTRMAP